MQAPERFIKLIEKGRLEEVEDWLVEASYGDCDYANDIRIELEPKGEYQGEGEYCLQYAKSSEGGIYAHEGTYYHKVEGIEKYIAYDYYIDA